MNRLKSIVVAAAVAVAAVLSPEPARAVECDQLSGGIGVCLPRYGTDFDQWATATINAFTLLDGSAAVKGSTSAYNALGWIAVNRISGMATGAAGIQISSATTFTSSVTITGGGGLGVTYGINAASGNFSGGVTASSFSAIGAQNNDYASRIENTFSGTNSYGLLIKTNGSGSNSVTALEVSSGSTNLLTVRNSGNVGVGSNANPGAKLDVNGDAQFGSGATRSTFSATGSLTMANDAAITLAGSGGYISSGSSIITSGMGSFSRIALGENAAHVCQLRVKDASGAYALCIGGNEDTAEMGERVLSVDGSDLHHYYTVPQDGSNVRSATWHFEYGGDGSNPSLTGSVGKYNPSAISVATDAVKSSNMVKWVRATTTKVGVFPQLAGTSTFYASIGASTYALDLSSGLSIAGGGKIALSNGGAIHWSDGSVSTSAFSTPGAGTVRVGSSVVTSAIEAPDSSTLGVAVSGSSITFTCSGANPIEIDLMTVLSDTNNGQTVDIGMYMDGAVIDSAFSATVGCSRMRETGGSSQGYFPASCHWVRSCSAGAHTFYWSISESGTTGRARCDEAPCVMTVQQTQ